MTENLLGIFTAVLRNWSHVVCRWSWSVIWISIKRLVKRSGFLKAKFTSGKKYWNSARY